MNQTVKFYLVLFGCAGLLLLIFYQGVSNPDKPSLMSLIAGEPKAPELSTEELADRDAKQRETEIGYQRGFALSSSFTGVGKPKDFALDHIAKIHQEKHAPYSSHQYHWRDGFKRGYLEGLNHQRR